MLITADQDNVALLRQQSDVSAASGARDEIPVRFEFFLRREIGDDEFSWFVAAGWDGAEGTPDDDFGVFARDFGCCCCATKER